jgi:large subunit ribosomal protein L10
MERDPRPEKVATVTDIKERFEDSRAVFVTEYRGLSVSEQQRLRRSLREASAEYKIYKMTLARRAAAEAGLDDLLDMLSGPTGLAFVSDDPVMAAKAMRDIASEVEAFALKGGILAGALVDADQIKALAEVEPREVQLSKMAGLLVASLQNMVGVMNSMMTGFATMMDQLAEKKESGEAPAAAEEAPAEEASGEAEAAEAPEASDPDEAPAEEEAEEAEAEEAEDKDEEAEAEADSDEPEEDQEQESTEE